MNASLATAERPAIELPLVKTIWIVVTQVKSNRVVYFTDDVDYEPPTEGGWYYVSSYAGVLPEGMTLRNCWGWCFNGGVFSDAREPAKTSARERLIDNNRRALLRILNEKIDLVREPHAPTSRDGHEVRRLKLAEAQRYLAAPPIANAEDAGFPLVQAAAVARGISMLEAAALVESKAKQCQAVWHETERFREQLSQAIGQATSEAQLLGLREWLLDKVYPTLTERFRFGVDNTVPANPDAPLSDAHRLHEITRLKVQLREAINRKRAHLASDYVQNDDIRKHKAKLAHAFLANGEARVAGIDFSVLENYASAHQIELTTAANTVLQSAAGAAQVLADTEKTKDELLARIEALHSLRDIHELDAALSRIVIEDRSGASPRSVPITGRDGDTPSPLNQD